MKKIWKVLAATAAAASVIPVFTESNETGGTVEALLWKAKWTKDPDYETKPQLDISIGLNNPFKKLGERKKEEDHLFADELMVDYCCDNTLAHDCAAEEMNSSETDSDASAPDKSSASEETAEKAETAETTTPPSPAAPVPETPPVSEQA